MSCHMFAINSPYSNIVLFKIFCHMCRYCCRTILQVLPNYTHSQNCEVSIIYLNYSHKADQNFTYQLGQNVLNNICLHVM